MVPPFSLLTFLCNVNNISGGQETESTKTLGSILGYMYLCQIPTVRLSMILDLPATSAGLAASGSSLGRVTSGITTHPTMSYNGVFPGALFWQLVDLCMCGCGFCPW